LNEIFDLFAALDADENQLDFPHVYSSAKQGWAVHQMGDEPRDMAPLFDLILGHVAPPVADPEGPFRMLATTLEANPYLGRLLTGRITSGRLKANAQLKALTRDGQPIETTRVTKILGFRGLERVSIDSAEAGDIVAIAGLTTATVADSLVDPAVEAPLPAQPIDPSTIAITFSVNDSPYAGQEGTKVTSRQIWDRLKREAEGNVAIKVQQSEDKESFEVAGRGELQLGVLIETMRREGFELSISRPRVLYQTDAETGQRLEPIEEVVVDVDADYAGIVVEKITARRGELRDMRPAGAGKQRLVFMAPSRALIGYIGEFLTDTRGTGVLNRVFHGFEPHKGPIAQRHTGVLISSEQGESVAYALWNLEDRGPMFIGAGERIYSGMIIGEHTRGNDLEVNPLKGKKLTNIRAAGSDEAVRLTPPIRMTLERAIAYIADDERVEVTPRSIRLRKRHLDPNERKKASRQKEVA
jgi:GTP-binding protein